MNFFSVFTTSNFLLQANSDLIDHSHRHHLLSIQISEQDVLDVLTSLHITDKATGIDGVGPRILKQCALILIKPLHHLFSASLSKCSIPYEWHIHIQLFLYIHKSGDKAQACPISLLSTTILFINLWHNIQSTGATSL